MIQKRKFYQKKRSFWGKLNLFLSLFLIIGILPIFITSFLGRMELEELLLKKPKVYKSEAEEILPEIVAKQISIHMPKEVIKAQCVIARTQFMAAKEKGEKTPDSFSIAKLQELWGVRFEEYYQKLQECVEATTGEVLQYQGNYIYGAYHQVSAGNTRNMSEYYEKNAMPYLKGVSCHEDSRADDYLNVYFWTKEEFITLCKSAFPDEQILGGNEIQIQKRDSAGYVLEVLVGQTVYEGEEFRKKLNLPSACLELTLIEDNIRIVTMGQGHGFGVSQNMAEILAEEGKTYVEILQYFYKDIEIVCITEEK